MKFLHPTTYQEVKIPLFLSKISAGFPSPADDMIEDTIDLNEYLISNPAASILVKVKGDSMMKVGIDEGDLLIIDRLEFL